MSLETTNHVETCDTRRRKQDKGNFYDGVLGL